MARRATTKAAAPKATTAKTPVERPVVSTAEITNETMVECRRLCSRMERSGRDSGDGVSRARFYAWQSAPFL